MLLFAGGAIVAAGLAASVYYVGESLAELEKTGVHSVEPNRSFETVQEITGMQGAYFVYFPDYNENPVNTPVKVTSPSGQTVLESEVNLPFYSEQFAAQDSGNYTFVIFNPSESSIAVSAIVGDPESILEVVGASSAIASFVLIAGITALVAGGVLVIIDRHKTQKMKHYGDLSDLK